MLISPLSPYPNLLLKVYWFHLCCWSTFFLSESFLDLQDMFIPGIMMVNSPFASLPLPRPGTAEYVNSSLLFIIIHYNFFLIVSFVKVFQICMAACLMLASDGDQPLPPLPTNTPLKVYQFLFIVHSTFFLIVSFVKVFQICMAACLMLALWWWSAPPPTPHKHSPESVSIPLYCSFYLLPDSFICESLPDLHGSMFNVG